MKKGYYKANSIHGVYYYGETLDEPETNVLPLRDFYDLLPVVGDDEEIFTFMDESDREVFDLIDSEYGVTL